MKKKKHFQWLTRWLHNDKWKKSLNITVSKWHGLPHSITYFLYLAGFVVSTYMWCLFEYAGF